MTEDRDNSAPEAEDKTGSWKLTAILSAVILLAAGGTLLVIFNSEPTAQRETATRQTAMLVDVTQVSRENHRPGIVVMGTVQPEREVVLSPRVNGEIVELSPGFTPGGFVQEGQVLLTIDPADFENALEQRKSALRQAEADLRVEMGRQNVARQDYELLDQTLDQENRELVLREPQLNSARARVESARAAVEQAELALQRTEVKAPFEAQVIERNVNVGSQVSPGERLAHLVGIDTYWVVATVPMNKLRWIEFPDPATGEEHGVKVQIRNRSAWPEGVTRTGHVDRLIGSLDQETRLARVLITVDDPLAREMSGGMSSDMSVPPMIIGAVVEARIQGRELRDVIRLDRDFIRENDTVWVKENGELRIRQVTIPVRDAQYAYITEGLRDGDNVVTSNLATVAEGAPLRIESPADAGMAQAGSTGEEATR